MRSFCEPIKKGRSTRIDISTFRESISALKSYLLVDARNLGNPRLMNDDNLLYINQGQPDNQGDLSFVFNKPEIEKEENVLHSCSCL